ncbi:MAG: SDR family oxidoreductase [Anaerolineales bacterium]|nr:SDR family oxidoreductase [Anaerolineales bacterium]MDW8446607.1 SDR family oxidoreductase [Anaerolineales bacterium]
MDLKLKGLRALITGASRGLGFATALRLAAEGVNLAINSRSTENLQHAAEKIEHETGSRPVIVPGDVAQREEAERVVHRAIDALGGLDLLATNAGGPPPGKFEELDDIAWQQAFELCLMMHVRLIRAALPALRRSKAASVVTFTSYSAKQPIPNLILSNTLRAGVLGLTKSLSQEYGPEGIRFNSVLPAWIETERVLALMEHRARINQSSVEEEIHKQAQQSVFGRMGTAEELASAVVFLLSPVSSYITGVMLTVDGGMYKALF